MSKKSNLNTGDKINKGRGGWDFNTGVAKTFDSHVKKSVPMYDEGHQIILDSSDYFIKNNSTVYDIGCSTGKLIKQLRLNDHPKWDSLAHSKLLSIIEKNFKIKIDEKNITNFSTFENTLWYINKE